jgi:hypothetical protein
VLWPLAANAQSDRVRRVGVLMGYAEADPAAQAQVAALRQELQKLGWEEGRNIRVDVRFPGTDGGKVRAMLMELMSLTPDVLVSNSNLVTAARNKIWRVGRAEVPHCLAAHSIVVWRNGLDHTPMLLCSARVSLGASHGLTRLGSRVRSESGLASMPRRPRRPSIYH